MLTGFVLFGFAVCVLLQMVINREQQKINAAQLAINRTLLSQLETNEMPNEQELIATFKIAFEESVTEYANANGLSTFEAMNKIFLAGTDYDAEAGAAWKKIFLEKMHLLSNPQRN